MNLEKYKHKIKKPNEHDYKTVYLYKEGVLEEKLTERECIKNYSIYIETEYYKFGYGACERHFDESAYNKEVDKYNDEGMRIWIDFCDDYTKHFNIENHELGFYMWKIIRIITPEIQNMDGMENMDITIISKLGITIPYDKLIEIGSIFKHIMKNIT
jgi:L-rhamnose mutarotase